MTKPGSGRSYCYGFRDHYHKKRCLKTCENYRDGKQCSFNVPWRYWDTERDQFNGPKKVDRNRHLEEFNDKELCK